MHKKFNIVILLVSATLLFIIINELLNQFTVYSGFISFIITIIPLVIYRDSLISFISKLTIKNYHLIISEIQKILEQLNDNLNRAVRYHEITKIIS
ncbi:MAG: hypothetical protein P8X42_11310, partial [Calditrichaceae bacterium]